MNFILIAVMVLGAIGLIAAVVLFAASKKFAVYEDPRIAQVGEVLPGANCGGCGFPGCSGMADALVKGADAGSLDGLFCPVGGADTMGKVADLLGMAIANTEPMVAVVRCNGTCEHRPRIAEYVGLRTCAAMHACGAGETACGFGCLGCGDCVEACQFDAIHINPETGIAEVDEEKCTSCGSCVKACPRGIIELRKKGPKGRRVFVSCVNKDKGPVAMKACAVSCIGCGKCVRRSVTSVRSPLRTTWPTLTTRSAVSAVSALPFVRSTPSSMSTSPHRRLLRNPRNPLLRSQLPQLNLLRLPQRNPLQLRSPRRIQLIPPNKKRR